jgi:ribosomal protein S18 acetylase RimI-like enzyme
MPEPTYETRPLREDERDWLSEVLLERWGGELIVGRGRLRQLSELQALVAWDGEERVGVATYVVEDGRAELVTLDALREGVGVGRRLIEAVAEADRAQGARELVVMTTNDNLRALRLYQRAGFRLHELRAGTVEEARRLKHPVVDRASGTRQPVCITSWVWQAASC